MSVKDRLAALRERHQELDEDICVTTQTTARISLLGK